MTALRKIAPTPTRRAAGRFAGQIRMRYNRVEMKTRIPVIHTFASLIPILVLAPSLMMSTTAARAGQPPVVMVSGTITAANGGTITVRSTNNTPPVSFKIPPSTDILIDGKASRASDLIVGLIVNVETSGGVVTDIYGRTPNTDAWGKVGAVTANSLTVIDHSGFGTTFTITPSTTVVIYTKPAAVPDIKVGAYADVKFTISDPTTAASIAILPPHGGHFTGTIAAISAKSITLHPARGPSIVFAIGPTAAVTLDGSVSKVSNIKVGEYADITALDAATATVINALSQPPVESDGGGGISD